MRSSLCLAMALVGVVMMSEPTDAAEGTAGPLPAALNWDMKTLGGEDVNLAQKYAGNVVLLVNVASYCGYTRQYEPLQDLQAMYGSQGLVVVGVPCNQFKNQEPDSAEQIAEFCSARGVTFDLLEKVEVNGDGACPLYKYLTSEETNPDFSGSIKWNFEKFLFSRDGLLVARYASAIEPDSIQMTSAIENELAEE